VLRIRHGRGTTVRPKNEWNILDPMVLSVLLEYGGSATLATELEEVRTALQSLMADLAARRITAEQRRDLDLCLNRMRAALPTEPGLGDPVAYREAAHLFARVLSEAAGNEVARCAVETIDVPLPEDDTEHGRGSFPRAQEFAERLYARVTGGPIPAQAGPVDEPHVDLAEPQPGQNGAPVSLPSQPPMLTTPLRRRPMVAGISR
jgi:DNA-binding FadR family transcriptional regulator